MLSVTAGSFGYGDRPVLAFPGLDLPKGAHCLVTGPSGSGKTTLLFAIAGLARIFAGHIRIDDTEIAALTEPARDRFRGRHMGIVFQTLHLVRSLTVIDNLLLAPYLAGLPQDRARALAVLERLGIAEKRDVRPEKLSQGEAQRVAVGRALLHKPRLILADEPTSSLDDASALASLRLIQQVARETEATLLVSSHDSRIKPLFERVVALEATS